MLGLGSSCASSARSPCGSSPVRSHELLAARAEVMRVSELDVEPGRSSCAPSAAGARRSAGWTTPTPALDRATRRISAGRASAAALFLVAVGAAVAVTAVIAQDLAVSTPVKALLVLTPVAVSEAITPLVDAMRALARARGSEHRIDALLDLAPAVADARSGDPRPRGRRRVGHPARAHGIRPQ